jgi:Bacterial SH3 domain
MLLAALAALAGSALAPAARAESSTVVRVLSEAAEVRTGPSFAYRSVYVAARGETLEAIDRASSGFWFKVLLPDGTYGWILGDEVITLAVDPTAPGPPSLGARFVDFVFSPAPLARADMGLTFSAGLLGGEGLVLFRPALLLAPHLALEGFVGETVGEQADVIYYGAAANLFLWPRSPVTPFFVLGGGGAHGRKKADQFTIKTGHYLTANVGGGLMFAFKKRVTLRLDFRNYSVFDANYTSDLQEYSGGLAVFF